MFIAVAARPHAAASSFSVVFTGARQIKALASACSSVITVGTREHDLVIWTPQTKNLKKKKPEKVIHFITMDHRKQNKKRLKTNHETMAGIISAGNISR